MTNKEIANVFNSLAKMMELHSENPYKIRSYSNAYIQIRKLQTPLAEMSDADIEAMKGVGKAISSKIREIQETGELTALKEYAAKTPVGIQQMLQIKGFGPKKIKTLWDKLEIETVGELLYACNENRLVELKGFGHKTQEDLRKKLTYFLQSRHKFHYASLEKELDELVDTIQKKYPHATVSLVGEMRRRCPIIEKIELLIASDEPIDDLFDGKLLSLSKQEESNYLAKTEADLNIHIYHYPQNIAGSKLFKHTGSRAFLEAFVKAAKGKDFTGFATEEALFTKAGIPYIPVELREDETSIAAAQSSQLPSLITDQDIKGVLHVHTTYSDGLHTLEDMVAYAHKLGYEYIGITDHSKAAFYANGLKEDRVLQQMQAIDELNKKYDDFRIFKGIESDILNDGSLDYEDDILKQFDFIIASVHSNLRMDKAKATTRLLKAIENPYTTILGHPTGRLLLSREGYPIDHQKVIDACAANQVSIELNANPYRLDIDWTWIPYAIEKGVLISINPDAHSKEGIHDIHYGVYPARKGGLSVATCLNAKSLADFEAMLQKK